jgi:hypothetical protein
MADFVAAAFPQARYPRASRYTQVSTAARLTSALSESFYAAMHISKGLHCSFWVLENQMNVCAPGFYCCCISASTAIYCLAAHTAEQILLM